MTTTELTLSTNLQVITAEINSYKQIAGQSIFEIGKRLKHVKENDLAHGQWEAWCQGELNISPRQARKYIRVFDRFANRNLGSEMGLKKLDALAAFDDEELETPVQLSSGEVKAPVAMNTKEIEKYKQQIREAETRAEEAEERARQMEAKHSLTVNQYSEQQDKLLTQIDELKKSKTKDSPETLKRIVELEQQVQQAQKLNNEVVILNRRLDEQREEYEQKITQQDKDMTDLREMKKAFRDMLLAMKLEGSKTFYHFSPIKAQKESQDEAARSLGLIREEIQTFFEKWEQQLNLFVGEVGRYEQSIGAFGSGRVIDVSPGTREDD